MKSTLKFLVIAFLTISAVSCTLPETAEEEIEILSPGGGSDQDDEGERDKPKT